MKLQLLFIALAASLINPTSANSLALPYSGITADQGFAFGITNTAHDDCIGIISSSWGETGKGIHGIAVSNRVDAVNYGGYFLTAGGKGAAVYGEATYSDWVENYGGYFVTKGKDGSGVYGEASGGQSTGVFGIHLENGLSGYLGGRQYGVLGTHVASRTTGVLGNKDFGVGGYFQSGGYSGFLGTRHYGVRSEGPLLVHGAGIRIENATGYPIMTIDGPSGWNTDFWGKVVIRSRPSGDAILELGEGLDYAEGFDVSNNVSISPGSVLIIDSYNPGNLTLSKYPQDTRVAGIVCGARGNKSGVRLGVDGYDQVVALAGRVYCNVDATFGAVLPGDLLTTSPTPGYAMVVKDRLQAQGSILGKAMESLERGQKGQILVLVTLQ